MRILESDIRGDRIKKLISAGLIVSFMLAGFPVLAQEEAKKGASEKAYEHASDKAVFNRVSDWFATIGKSGEEKEKILAERKAERAAKRVEKELKRAEKEKEAKKAREGMEEKARKQKESVEKMDSDAGGLMKGQKKAKGRNK
ncbi:MAG: hypothetical protein COV72_01780 [Candidatus Omnitrophica bacterium CG11_big_fil_rev_8_21_14_0_20_42_13]|uniref:Uncharacterized protein n=1 Tax=Candidatus Ghiorseimicrobium undicola TaxID=1974746 RepID=A0A2H0LZ49_9BACT|nr:MAG: hypothetical protein COV72_01780 [Candidatus Omnitrophica bacterium CG11_big_fil_rev_8_21_14_0_20_42_13]